MKKLLTSFIIGVVLITIFATPAFADSEKSNMPGKAADGWQGLCNALTIIAFGINQGHAFDSIFGVINGYPPGKPSGGGF